MSEETPNDSGVEMEAAAPVTDVNHDVQEAQEEKQVPLAALEAERTQRQQLQDEVKMIKDHLSLMQARTQAPQQQEESLAEDDVMTYGEFKKLATKFQNEIKSSLSEMQMTKRFPDYEDVVKKYLPDVIKNRPKIGQYLQQTQDYEYAYEVAKASDSYRKDHTQKQKSADAERLMGNAQKAGSLSSVGGTTPISMAKRYKDMTDTDFRKEMAKNMGYV